MNSRGALSRGFQVLAGGAVLSGVWLLTQMLWVVNRLPARETLGGWLYAAVFLAAVLCIGRLLWSRAGLFDGRVGGSLIASALPALLRTAGAVYVALAVGVGAGGCVFMWLGGQDPFAPVWSLSGILFAPVWALGGILPHASGEANFAGGSTFLLSLSSFSLLAATLLHFLAEAVEGLARGQVASADRRLKSKTQV